PPLPGALVRKLGGLSGTPAKKAEVPLGREGSVGVTPSYGTNEGSAAAGAAVGELTGGASESARQPTVSAAPPAARAAIPPMKLRRSKWCDPVIGGPCLGSFASLR